MQAEAHQKASRLAIATLYASTVLQGLTLVSYPALAGVLRTTVGLDDAQYGASFLPQVVATALAALGGGALARRLALRPVLALALVLNAIAELLLVASGVWPAAGFPLVLAGTASLGLGFGLSAAPLNALPGRLLPARRESALVAAHAGIGAGLALGPVLAAALAAAGRWQLLPAGLAIAASLLAPGALVALPRSDDAPARTARAGRSPAATGAFWLLAATAVVYALAEGTFSGWAVIYLSEDRGLGGASAALGLTAFWTALVAGRIAVAALVERLGTLRLWLALPPLMIAAFLCLPHVRTAAGGVLAFALAGFACSGFFPLTVARAAARYPDDVAAVSSLLVAALMLGVGLGSFTVGPLRAALPLADLYELAALYPALAFVLALANCRAPSVRLALERAR
ncbi:MAG: MFS transporter [Gammaproteobacteria bacterium]|nr:MFS transporter [Gammaproteobacteria bacterium]